MDDEEDKDYIQVPEEHHQMNEDSTSLETSSNTEHHQEENEIHHDGNPDEVSTLEGRSHHRTEEDTGHKYENIPTKLVTERTKPHFPREDEKEHKMIQTENSELNISPLYEASVKCKALLNAVFFILFFYFFACNYHNTIKWNIYCFNPNIELNH